MAELHVSTDEKVGILKEIDEGAIDLVFQAIQEDMYSHPIESFVRESISNGLDSYIERDVHQAIRKGKPVEDFYRQKQDGRLLKDSEYNADYYNHLHLSDDNVVEVLYTDGNPRDTISITDRGVGLGGDRLKGFFRLGYSSKRNMKSVIGKFGAGAKAGLSTGVDFFIMHTTYNGYSTSFMILKNDYDPITPKTELGKTDIWTVRMADGSVKDMPIHWTKTNEKNGVTIELEVKKHNKNVFLDAVRNQFQYFNGRVSLKYNNSDGYAQHKTLNEKPLYESDVLLIPKYSTYTNPHILVDGIAYGLISWPELELQRRQGKIAIKVPATAVDITQNRESLKWTEKTKKVILNAVQLAETEASDYITEQLHNENEDDLFATNNLYGSVGKNSSNEVSAVFSKFLDIHTIRPKFTVDYTDNYGSFKVKTVLSKEFFAALFYKFTVKRVTMEVHGDTVRLKSETVDNFDMLRGSKIVHAREANLGPKLAEYLMNKVYNVNSLIYVRRGSQRVKFQVEINRELFSVNTISRYTNKMLDTYADLNLDTYDVVYKDDKEELDGCSVSTKVARVALDKIRKANKEVLYQEYINVNPSLGSVFWDKYSARVVKKTVKIADVENLFKDKEVIVTTGKYKKLAKLVELVNYFSWKEQEIIYVSQESLPHFAPYCTVITDYFRQVNKQTGELMIGEAIRNLNTMRLLNEIQSKFSFASNYEILKLLTNIDVEEFKTLTQRSRGKTIEFLLKENKALDDDTRRDIWGYLDALNTFHHVVKSGDPEEIAKTAKGMFNSDAIYTVDAYDEELITSITSELERIGVVAPIINELPYKGIPQEAAALLTEFINFKNNKDVNI